MQQNSSSLVGMFRIRDLPDKALDPYWDDIVIDERKKEALYNYCFWLLQAKELSAIRCGMYRMLLLYGPPGTGKSTLARGCANEVARKKLTLTGEQTRLLELNVSSLFSEFLGKTAKAITEAFRAVRMAARQNTTIVIVDELESLGMERSTLGAGDPSDVLRGINLFLTELDQLRHCEGVVLLATSNLTSRIDGGVWDRVDVKIYIGNPTKQAAHKILLQSSEELKKMDVEFALSFIDRLTDKLYDGTFGVALSGRDLSKLLPVTVAIGSGNCMEVEDVLWVAKEFVAKDKEEVSHGSNCKEIGGRDEQTNYLAGKRESPAGEDCLHDKIEAQRQGTEVSCSLAGAPDSPDLRRGTQKNAIKIRRGNM